MEKKTGLKMTPQRAAILEYLEGNTKHPSADDIYRAIKEKYPMVSFATVYNTLETLRNMGMVWELNIDDERKRYDPNTRPHHHLICLRCRRVVDVRVDFEIEYTDKMAEGFMVTGHHVEFYGVCSECQKLGPQN